VAHSLPVEIMITRRAGVRARVMLPLRIIMAFLSAFFAMQVAIFMGLNEIEASITLPPPPDDNSLLGWVTNQVIGLMFVQLVIIVLLTGLKLLKIIGVEELMRLSLTPFLRLIGIGKDAATIAVVGVTLGIGFGGGLLIREVDSGRIPKHDVFGVLTFLAIIHSIFEDTAVVMLIGPDFLIITIGRLLMAMILTAILTRVTINVSDVIWRKHLINQYVKT